MIRKGLAGLVVLGTVYFLAFGGDYTFLDLWRLEREREAEVAELEAIRVELGALRQRADSLASDSAALERIARERYGLIREGERLYRFVLPDSTAGEALTPEQPDRGDSTDPADGGV